MIQIPVEPPVTEYLFRKATKERIPLGGTFELTPVCNMDCRMCYVKMSRQQQEAIRPLIKAEEWLKLAEEAKEQGLLYLLLTGGEPFGRRDFREILSGLHKMGLILTVNSNGTLIDEETVEWLVRTPPVRINITLYGASDETYERLCRNPKGFRFFFCSICTKRRLWRFFHATDVQPWGKGQRHGPLLGGGFG